MKVAALFKRVWRFGTYRLAWKWFKKEQGCVSKSKSKSLKNMIFWNCLFFLRCNSKHKEILLTGTLHEKGWFLKIFLVNVNKSASTCRYLYLKVLVYGSWNCVHVWGSFFVSVFYMLWAIKVWSGDLYRRTDCEGRI